MENLHNIIPPLITAPIILVVWLLGLWLLKRIAIRRLKKWTPKSTVGWADLLIESISFPANFLILASGLAVFTNILPLPDKYSHWANMTLQGSVIVAIVIFFDKLLRGVMDEYAARSLFTRASHGITKGLIRGFIIGIGVLIFLDLIGISITPILASLGIGSFAVALALQDTLSNFFAGLYVAIDKPVKVNDFIRLETGQEGCVIDIGWRSTRIRTPQNNVVIIPNSKLMGSVITNYHLPSQDLAVSVEAGVHYQSDLAKVEKVSTEVAKEMMIRSGVIPGFEPFIHFHTLGESGIHFTVTLRAKTFEDQNLIKHEFIKKLIQRFREEGIVIPYPTHSIEITERK